MHMDLSGSPVGISKLSGQAKAATYPQPEGTLGEAMLAYGRKLGETESVFGKPSKKMIISNAFFSVSKTSEAIIE